MRDNTVLTNKEYLAYMQEVARQVYLQGAADATNGYVAGDIADIDDIIEQVGREILSRGNVSNGN